MLLFLSLLESESKKSLKNSHEQHLNLFHPPPPPIRPKSWKNSKIRHGFAERQLSSALWVNVQFGHCQSFINELTLNPNSLKNLDPRM